MSISCTACDNKGFIKMDCKMCNATGINESNKKCEHCNGFGKITVKCLSKECNEYREIFSEYCAKRNKII